MTKFFVILITLSLSSLGMAKDIKIVFLGDSLTEGYGIDQQQAYPRIVESLFQKEGFSQVKVLNSGISGSTTASSTKRLKWVLKSKPQVVLLALGANDGLRGVDVSASKKNLMDAIDLCKKNNVKVVLAGMRMPPNYGKDYRKKFRAMYIEVAKKTGSPLIPFLLQGVAGEKKLNLSDGIHPNEDGHVLMAKTVYSFLKPLVVKWFNLKQS